MKHIANFTAAALFAVALLLPACNSDEVYICTGPHSHAYHTDRHCEGLDRCSRTIETVTLEEAEDMGRHPCRFCCE